MNTRARPLATAFAALIALIALPLNGCIPPQAPATVATAASETIAAQELAAADVPSPEAVMEQASSLLADGDVEGALELTDQLIDRCSQAIAMYPDDPNPYLCRGTAYWQRLQLPPQTDEADPADDLHSHVIAAADSAIVDLDAALELDSASVNAYALRAMARHSRAAALVKRLRPESRLIDLDLDLSSPELKWVTEDVGRIIADCDQAMALDPERDDVRFTRCLAYMLGQDQEQVGPCLASLAEDFAGTPQGDVALGLLMQVGDMESMQRH